MGNFNRYFIQHSPCVINKIFGRCETDIVCGFRFHPWPNVASPWIQRCKLQRWPQDRVSKSIIKEGFHVIPISSLPLTPGRDKEWRISFSKAERKLFYSLNHRQFLCYGLLKKFWKEVINAHKNEPCLCSLFMKTIVFWVIQNDSRKEWVPQNLLICVWTCFKLMISWVYRGEFPLIYSSRQHVQGKSCWTYTSFVV